MPLDIETKGKDNLTQPKAEQKFQGQELGPESTYSSQVLMYQALNKEGPAELCSPIANMALEFDLTHHTSPDILHSSNKEAYERAIVYREQQVSLTKKGGDGANYGFIHTNTPYKTTELPAKYAKEKLDIEDIATTNGHTLITYPVESSAYNPDPYHQIYIKRDSLTRCVQVDAGHEGGEETADCTVLVNRLRDSISSSEEPARPEKVVVIASDSPRQASSFSFFSNTTTESTQIKNNTEVAYKEPSKEPDAQEAIDRYSPSPF